MKNAFALTFSVLFNAFFTLNLSAQPFKVEQLDSAFYEAHLNDKGSVIGLKTSSPTDDAYQVILRSTDGQVARIGATTLNPTTVAFTNTNAVAGVQSSDGSVVVLQAGKSDLLIKHVLADDYVGSISMNEQGTLAFIETRGSDKTLANYALIYTKATTEPVLTAEVNLPNQAFGSAIWVLDDDRVLLYSYDGSDNKNVYFILTGTTITPIPTAILSSNAVVRSTLPGGKVLVGIKDVETRTVTGAFYSSDLTTPPVSLGGSIDAHALSNFIPQSANLSGTQVGGGATFGFYQDEQNPLSVFLPQAPALPLDCFYPQSSGFRFIDDGGIQKFVSEINSTGQVLTTMRTSGSADTPVFVLLTPSAQASFTSYCPNISVKIPSSCRRVVRANGDAACKVVLSAATPDGLPAAGITATAYQFGKQKVGGDGIYFPGPRRARVSGRTKASGKVTLKFNLGSGTRLYEIVAPVGDTTLRSKAFSFVGKR